MIASALHATAWLAAAVPTVPCSSEPRFDIAVFAEHRPPIVRSNHSLSQLHALAARSAQPRKHAPLGFYAGTFGYTVEVTADKADPLGCVPAMHVRVRMFLADRLVEIGTDLQSRQCRPEAVLSHYLLHADQDDWLLSQYAHRALTMFDRMPRSELLGVPFQGDAREAVAVVVRRAMDELLLPYDEDRRRSLDAADSHEELARLRGACGRDP